MTQSRLPFPDFQVELSGTYVEPSIWLRRLVLVESPLPPLRIIRRITFRRGINIICTQPRLPEDTQPVGHSVGKSLMVRIIRYCLGEDRFCTDSQRTAIALKHERAYVFAVVRINGEDWSVARPLGLETGYSDSWCVRSHRIKALLPQEGRLKYREFVDALNKATSDCYANIDLPRAERRANWRDLLGWLSRDQDCHFAHHADWRASELQAGPRALTREDAYLVMRMALGLLGPDEIGLMEKHRQLLAQKTQSETLVRQYTAYVEQSEQRLRGALEELKDQLPGEVFGSAFVNIAVNKAESLGKLLEDPDVLDRQELASLNDALATSLREEGSLQAALDDLDVKKTATQAELENAQKQDASTLLRTLGSLRWKCSYFPKEDDAVRAGCPGEKMIDQGIADPWRQQRIADLKNELVAVNGRTEATQAALAKARDSTRIIRQSLSRATAEFVRVRGDITRQIGQWMSRKEEAERYSAAWRDLNVIVNGRDAREKQIEVSAASLRVARNRFEKQKGNLSGYYDAVLKRIISPRAEGKIEVDGDGLRPESNSVVADSGTTLREYADVLSLDVACLVASVCGLGHLPRLWIHDSPRQADSEEQLYHSILECLRELEARYPQGRKPSFQYILTTTSAPPDVVNVLPFVRLRLHARNAEGKLLRCDFGK